ncbi:MAG: orotate phosphoribosyltransferase [Clostridia bacterium]|nr:orotate phosphoribosyltransferase [Clostridia bacterium]
MNLFGFLFKTNAVNICPENSPFWYTSGKIGPYYINAEFLYGSKQDSENLLNCINAEKNNELELPKKVFEKVQKQYDENEIYRHVINEMKRKIEDNIDINEIDYISGGERRDWFFSYMIAKLLKKPHITIYKNLNAVISDSDFKDTKTVERIEGKRVLHIVDMINTSSSYTRAWIPVIEKLGAKIKWSMSCVDRMQGGAKVLEDNGIKCMSIVQVDKNLFDKALELKVINEEQYNMVNEYIKNPDETMRKFLISHPDFLKNALSSDEKTAGRAKMCIEQNLYNLD